MTLRQIGGRFIVLMAMAYAGVVATPATAEAADCCSGGADCGALEYCCKPESLGALACNPTGGKSGYCRDDCNDIEP